MADAELLDLTLKDDRLRAVGRGAWTSETAAALERAVDAAARDFPHPAAVEIEMSDVERLDTFGALLLERLRRAWSGDGIAFTLSGLDPRYHALLDEMTRMGREPVPPPRRTRGVLERLGVLVVEGIRDSVALMNFIGATISACLRMVLRPRTLRFTSMVNQMDVAGFRAVPIILLITFLIGAILGQQGVFHFSQFGAEIYVVDMVGVLVLRELGVLIVSIMIAGRSGSAFTAELGSMRMREEVDALRVMGFDPVQILVVPRILALILVLPLLAFLGAMSAIFGGGLVCWLYGGIAPDVFLDRLREAVSMDHFLVGIIKAPFMAAVIGLVSCMEGLSVGGSAESLGKHTTAAVVKAIFLVIVMDGLFAIFFASINM